MKSILVFLFLIQAWLMPCAQELPSSPVPPKREVRAAWLTTIYGLDWPHTQATTPASINKQKEELLTILNRLKEAHFNTVLFQARTRGDVLYPSRIEPFNAILTGKTGRTPGYDPLAFVIEECHKRGMECHAWMVTIPAGSRKQAAALGKQGVVRRKPHLCIAHKGEYYLNPGHPDTDDYLMGLVREIVEGYDIDGIHLDYLRYPENAPHFNDRKAYRQYAHGESLATWRRGNITRIMSRIYQGVKQLKPWVKVSTSPVGKYDDTARYPSRGWNALHTVHQDVQAWMGMGIQDQIYPMMYFRGNHFYPFALDWKEQAAGRQVVPGLGIYFLHPKEGDWPIEEVERQIAFCRTHGLAGTGHYRVKFLMEDTGGIYTALRQSYYTAPALTPATTWIDSIAPTAPTHLTAKQMPRGCVHLQWQAGTDNEQRTEVEYVIYASDTHPVDTSNPNRIVAQKIRGTQYVYAPLYPWQAKRYFAVTAIDRSGNESTSTAVVAVEPSAAAPQ